jgi:hypothetical protein
VLWFSQRAEIPSTLYWLKFICPLSGWIYYSRDFCATWLNQISCLKTVDKMLNLRVACQNSSYSDRPHAQLYGQFDHKCLPHSTALYNYGTQSSGWIVGSFWNHLTCCRQLCMNPTVEILWAVTTVHAVFKLQAPSVTRSLMTALYPSVIVWFNEKKLNN